MRRLFLILGITCALCASARAQTKLSELPAATTATTDDLTIIVDSPASGAATKNITVGNFAGSIFGLKTTTDLAEGTNLYWTTARFNSAFGAKSTTDLPEGSNLYWTSGRFDTAFAGKSTTDLAEGSNLYFTNVRARGAFTFNSPLSLNSGTGVVSVQQSDATHDGYLTQGDWSAFNGKQAALGFTPEDTAHKDAASGYAGLDASSLLKAAEFPAFTGDATKPAGSLVMTVAKVNGNIPGGTCTNQFVRSLNSSAVPTCASIAGADMPALTGDVTTSAGSVATTVANNAVSYAKMQDVSAASKLIGRGSSGTGDPQEITLGSNLSMSGTTLSVTVGGVGGWTDGTTRTVGASSTQYQYLMGPGTTFNGTETNRQNVLPDGFTISRLYIRTSSTQPNDGALTCTVRDNATDTSVVVTIAANSAAGTFSDTSNSASIAAGHLVSLKCVNASASTSAGVFDMRFVMVRN